MHGRSHRGTVTGDIHSSQSLLDEPAEDAAGAEEEPVDEEPVDEEPVDEEPFDAPEDEESEDAEAEDDARLSVR
ncbi:MAG TPA: hypothetical protein VNZ66_03010 [Aeromicrobium sp.]|nr:hypothetical protein [Aeromicrobium sp.]